jgi:hypothetical protein
MKPALIRRLAPLALLAVPFLVPVVATPGGATTSSTTVLPTIARGVAFGTSMGQSSSRTTSIFPNARVGRVFQSSPSTRLPALPSSYQIWLSFRTDPSTVASGAFNQQFGTILRAWNASGRTVYWTWRHEADRGIGITATQFRAGWAQLLKVAAQNPSTRVHSMSILTGFVLNPHQPHGNPESWYVPTEVLGFDCYMPDNLTRAMKYAQSKHKKWAVPEFGAHLGDLKDLQYLKSSMTQWAAYPPIGASWYNNTASAGFSQPLTQIPQTLSYLRSLAG